MVFLTLLKRSLWTYYLLFLICVVKPSKQTSSDDIKDNPQEMKNLLLGSLDEMDARLVSIENTIANDIKVNIEKISSEIDNVSKQINQMKEDFNSCNSSLNTLSPRSIEICSTIDDHKVRLDTTLKNNEMIISKIGVQNVIFNSMLKYTAKMISKIGDLNVDLNTMFNNTAMMINKTVEHEVPANPSDGPGVAGLVGCLDVKMELVVWWSSGGSNNSEYVQYVFESINDPSKDLVFHRIMIKARSFKNMIKARSFERMIKVRIFERLDVFDIDRSSFDTMKGVSQFKLLGGTTKRLVDKFKKKETRLLKRCKKITYKCYKHFKKVEKTLEIKKYVHRAHCGGGEQQICNYAKVCTYSVDCL